MKRYITVPPAATVDHPIKTMDLRFLITKHISGDPRAMHDHATIEHFIVLRDGIRAHEHHAVWVLEDGPYQHLKTLITSLRGLAPEIMTDIADIILAVTGAPIKDPRPTEKKE